MTAQAPAAFTATRDSIMTMTEAQRRRAMSSLDVPWDVNLYDPRDPRGVVHPHLGLLSMAVAGFALGQKNFRGAEDMAEDLGPRGRRRLGLRQKARRPSDTALYTLVSRQNPEGFRETVQTQVEEWLADGSVTNDLFERGVVSFDGKGSWSSTTHHLAGAKQSSCDAEGMKLSLLGSLRAVLTSSSARPCIDVELIADKEAESPTFRAMYPRVLKEFGEHFALVTGDAGLTARENATLVRQEPTPKHYLFWLKDNQPKLNAVADAALCEKPRLRTEERRNGKTVTRTLFVLDVADSTVVDMAGTAQVWCIRQTTKAKGEKLVVEDRHFITSMPEDFLDDAERLALVRLHWGIENGHNWTMDMVLDEDDSRPCQAGKDSVEVVLWLRVLAYNHLSRWRATLGLKDKRPYSWRRAVELLRDALVHCASPKVSVATLA